MGKVYTVFMQRKCDPRNFLSAERHFRDKGNTNIFFNVQEFRKYSFHNTFKKILIEDKWRKDTEGTDDDHQIHLKMQLR